MDGAAALQLTGRMYFATPDNGIKVPNVSINAVHESNVRWPTGKVVPMDMDFLSLGASDQQAWGIYRGIPGSLIFGGYDSNRAIGEFGTYDTNDGSGGMFAQLIDVHLGVESGGSPWEFRNKPNLLLDPKNESEPITVRPNPSVPFLYLPNKTCSAVARWLPVTWRWELGLCTWDTTHPTYEEIIKSPSYLQLVFSRAGGVSPITIKVPFALLNLTLAPPIVSSKTQYFPCRPYEAHGNEYHIGRVLAGCIQALLRSAPSSFFAESWKGVLKNIPTNGSEGHSSSIHGDRLSDGSIAGIVVAIVAGAALLGLLAFLYWRRRKWLQRSEAPQEMQDVQELDVKAKSARDSAKPQSVHELQASEPVAYESADDRQASTI
ncbi:hypothetical protein BBP40_010040 [Aspergillus hancockii]|nr:hypothetical protein BBP40_010040 [Aspergillus hancockii]